MNKTFKSHDKKLILPSFVLSNPVERVHHIIDTGSNIC